MKSKKRNRHKSEERLLRIEATHFVAGSVWKKREGVWCCVEAAPILSWMVGKDPNYIKQYLEKKNWRYSWIT